MVDRIVSFFLDKKTDLWCATVTNVVKATDLGLIQIRWQMKAKAPYYPIMIDIIVWYFLYCGRNVD